MLLLALFAGCSGSEFPIVPVSGNVTFDGEPLVGAEVVFAPMETNESVFVGPASVGTTDDQGNYSLTTIKGTEGAVATKRRVSVGFKGINGAELTRRLDAQYNKNPGMSEQKYKALERKIRESLKKELGPQKDIPESYNRRTRLSFVVEGPTDGADFDLKSDGS